MTEVNQQQLQDHELPPTPRAVTRRGWWRAWGDRRVRVWLICAAAITGIMAFIATNQLGAALRERQLTRQGTPMIATLVELEGSRRFGSSLPRTDTRDVTLQATMPDGTPRDFKGRLPPGGSGHWRVGQEMEIRVDPNNPARWTHRTEMTGWGTELVIPLSLLPLIALLLALAIWQRTRVLNIWRHGTPVQAVVLELRHTAIAPFSRIVRYSVPEHHDKRIYSTLVPNKDGVPQVGETIRLVALPERTERAVVAKLYS